MNWFQLGAVLSLSQALLQALAYKDATAFALFTWELDQEEPFLTHG